MDPQSPNAESKAKPTPTSTPVNKTTYSLFTKSEVRIPRNLNKTNHLPTLKKTRSSVNFWSSHRGYTPFTPPHDIPKSGVFYKLTVEGDFGPKEAVPMNTKSLRKGVLLAAGLLAISASPMLATAAAMPQDAGQAQAAPADQAKPSRPDLNLTDDQKAQMKKIHEGAKSQIAAVNNDSSLSADQKQAKIRAIRRDTHKQTEALLTPEQRQTQKQWHKSHPRQNQDDQRPPAAS